MLDQLVGIRKLKRIRGPIEKEPIEKEPMEKEPMEKEPMEKGKKE
jgi:hypothetical protein